MAGSTARKTDPKLWEKVKARVTKGDKGGKPGQWSARKAQLATAEYKKEGGGYAGGRSEGNSLHRWTEEEWGTKSGKESGKTGERYLPKKARETLSDGEYARSTAKKRRDTKAGRQFSAQPKDVARKAATARKGASGTARKASAGTARKAAAPRKAAAAPASTARKAAPRKATATARKPAAPRKAAPKRAGTARKRPPAATKRAATTTKRTAATATKRASGAATKRASGTATKRTAATTTKRASGTSTKRAAGATTKRATAATAKRTTAATRRAPATRKASTPRKKA